MITLIRERGRFSEYSRPPPPHGHAHHLHHPETLAARLPADRPSGALDRRRLEGGRRPATAYPTTLAPGEIFSFQRDLIRFRLIKHSGDPQMMRAKLEGDKLPIPETIIQKAGLKDGDEVEVGLEDGKVVIKPLASLAEFKRELRGCVESSKIDPLEAKRIWEA